MSNLRIIPRLDIKGPNLIKGVQLEGLRVMGDPQAFAIRYYEVINPIYINRSSQGWPNHFDIINTILVFMKSIKDEKVST